MRVVTGFLRVGLDFLADGLRTLFWKNVYPLIGLVMVALVAAALYYKEWTDASRIGNACLLVPQDMYILSEHLVLQRGERRHCNSIIRSSPENCLICSGWSGFIGIEDSDWQTLSIIGMGSSRSMF